MICELLKDHLPSGTKFLIITFGEGRSMAAQGTGQPIEALPHLRELLVKIDHNIN